ASLSTETINGDPYYLQWAFNSSGLTSRHTFECWTGATLEPYFTAPNPVNAGDVVGFDGSGSDITLDANVKGLPPDEPFTAPVYKWDFGDGTVVSGAGDASEFHSYQYGGTYDVTLTVTDSGGNTNRFTEPIKVNGPAPPSPGGPGGGGPSSGAATGPSSGGGSKPPASSPVATQIVLSHSLSRTLRGGLVVHYSVDQQVAGHFEVLLAASIARRIHLHGPLATGLPAGTPAQVVVAKAILITTKGGHSTIKIEFGKAAAKRLHRLPRVALMLRLVLRNASGGINTVLSRITLSH
ncbi:MAG TPA: PKD domain-containing protein, partial [Solirubrobacteraceae bacterium]|nr:PKD domain-containing protein [Solirubrobacteraceae bacterium]